MHERPATHYSRQLPEQNQSPENRFSFWSALDTIMLPDGDCDVCVERLPPQRDSRALQRDWSWVALDMQRAALKPR